eukprot:1442-Heterococcus_DN1.PRE.3
MKPPRALHVICWAVIVCFASTASLRGSENEHDALEAQTSPDTAASGALPAAERKLIAPEHPEALDGSATASSTVAAPDTAAAAHSSKTSLSTVQVDSNAAKDSPGQC